MALPAESVDQPGRTAFPPGPGWPTLVQTFWWQTRFAEFNGWLSRRYGNIFTVKLPFSGSVVSVAEPDLIRTLFADRGERTHAGEANRILEPIMGRNSVLLLDGPSTPGSASWSTLRSTASAWPLTATSSAS